MFSLQALFVLYSRTRVRVVISNLEEDTEPNEIIPPGLIESLMQIDELHIRANLEHD